MKRISGVIVMAERRMFSKVIISSDAFLDMSTSARCLYFHLGMQADDDGFVSSPKAIVRSVNCSEDDLKLLIAKRFVIAFESGIVVIRHWKQHNYIPKDRYKPTTYLDEREKIMFENGVYEERIQDAPMLDTCCIQTVSEPYTQDRIGKDRIGKDNKDTICPEPKQPDDSPTIISLTLNDKTEYGITQKDIDEWGKLYPAVDIIQELRKMRGWLDSNPDRRKTRRGVRRFVNSWLSQEQDKGGVKSYGAGGRNTEPESSASAKLW